MVTGRHILFTYNITITIMNLMNHKAFILKALVSHQKLLPVYNLFGHKLKFNEFHERKL